MNCLESPREYSFDDINRPDVFEWWNALQVLGRENFLSILQKKIGLFLCWEAKLVRITARLFLWFSEHIWLYVEREGGCVWEEDGEMPPWVRQLESAGDWSHVQAVRHPATRFTTEVKGID